LRIVRGTLALVLLLAVSAGAQAQTRADSALTSRKPPRGRRCVLFGKPPAVAKIIDSVALSSLLREEWPSRKSQQRFVLLTMSTDTLGEVSSRVLESDFPDAIAEAMRRRVMLHLKPHGRYAARLRIDGGDPIRLRTGYFEECPPKIRNPEEIRAIVLSPDMRERAARAGVFRRIPIVAEFVLDTLGRAGSPMTFTPFLGPAVDSLMVSVVRAMRFHPATIDGRPIRVLVRQSVTLGP
jgi:hypothetical protein